MVGAHGPTLFHIPALAAPGALWLNAAESPAAAAGIAMSTVFLIVLFMPWACAVGLGHVAKQEFRAHLRRRHPRAYQRVYGAHADRRRHSALDPLVWLLQLRFELSPACHAFGDEQLHRLGRRLRRRMLGAVALYFLAIAAVVAADHGAPAAAAPAPSALSPR